MDNYDPREILKKLKQRTKERMTYEWRVQIHRPIDDILEMIQRRHDPEYQAQAKEPYTVTANFTTLKEAQEYACMVRMRGLSCGISNNWTGDEYKE